ncbi:MAG TPA: hypothetical protein VE553_05050 [Candidatus Binatia bacterium]|nr:hypothetical protein [Candidatus Binatia bacterium]
MSQALHETLRTLLSQAARSDEGRETLQRYDHLVFFDVLDGEPFYADIAGGVADVASGVPSPRPIAEAHSIKANESALRDWFEGRLRYSDGIHENLLFPVAAHTTKRHIDNWIVKLVRLGQGRPSLRDEY